MTEKELHRLRRQDLLQLLLAQSEETEELSQKLSETEGQLHQIEESSRKLRDRLEQKDEKMVQVQQEMQEQIRQTEETYGRLAKKLAQKEEKIAQIREEAEAQIQVRQDNYDRLYHRLEQKNEKIRELQETLEAERNQRRSEVEAAGTIAEAALRLNGVYEAAEAAVAQYLQNIQWQYTKHE